MADLKLKLIERIKETSDIKILHEVRRLLEMDSVVQNVYVFSDEEKALISKSKKQVEAGEYLTNKHSNQLTLKSGYKESNLVALGA